MTATYTKLRSGEWGIRVQGQVSKGDRIVVAKKSGASKTEIVRRVVWTGNGITLCAIEQSASPSRGRNANTREIYRRRYGWDGVVGSPSYYASGLYDEES